MKTSNAMSVLRGAIAAGSLLWAIGSCGRAADDEDLQIDSNTNWLMRCSSDDQCSGSLRCYCGQCSQPCAQSDECSLLAGAQCTSTGGAVCDDQPALGGLCVLGCSEDTECGPEFSCIGGQCLPKPCEGRFQSWDDVLGAVADDLRSLDASDRLFARYISLANHSLNAGCSITLRTERLAINKLINSLSIETTVEQAAQLDSDGTLYRIDLRDYGWDRSVEVGNVTYVDAWEAIVANNPLAVSFIGDDAADIAAATGRSVSVMFADSFTAAATRPAVYAGILAIPSDFEALLAELGIDRADPDAFRAGFVSRTEIVATHWDIKNRTGYLWEIADVGRDEGALFADPLLEPVGERAVIYTLRNGLQAFAYMGSEGRWLDDSSTFIDVTANNFRAAAPLSLLREHSPTVIVRDEVLNYVRANPGRYTPEALSAIDLQYLDERELGNLLERESATFVQSALAGAGVPAPPGPDPISLTFDEYDNDVTLEIAAGDLMVTPEDLSDSLNLLDPALQVLDGGRIDRGDFEVFYRNSICTLLVLGDNMPESCR